MLAPQCPALTYTVKTELLALHKIGYIVGISEFSLMIFRYHQLNDVYKYFQAPIPQYFDYLSKNDVCKYFQPPRTYLFSKYSYSQENYQFEVSASIHWGLPSTITAVVFGLCQHHSSVVSQHPLFTHTNQILCFLKAVKLHSKDAWIVV